MRTRKRAGNVEYLVKWQEYSDTFNSWVDTLVRQNEYTLFLVDSAIEFIDGILSIQQGCSLHNQSAASYGTGRRLGSGAHGNIGALAVTYRYEISPFLYAILYG